jgi:hypothetical protein
VASAIANETAMVIGNTIKNAARVAEGVSDVAVSTTKVADSSVKLVDNTVKLVTDVTDAGRKSIEVVNASQDAAITAINGTSNIIDKSALLSSEAIIALTNKTREADILTKEGLGVATSGIAVLNEFLTTNKRALSDLFAGPVAVGNTAFKGLSTLLTIVITSPLSAVTNKLEQYSKTLAIKRAQSLALKEKQAKYDMELKDKELSMNNSAKMRELDTIYQIKEKEEEIKRINAMMELAKVSIEKQKQLDAVINKVKADTSNVPNPIAVPPPNQNSIPTPVETKVVGAGEGDVLDTIEDFVEQNPQGLERAIEVREQIDNAITGGMNKQIRKKKTKKNKKIRGNKSLRRRRKNSKK